MGDYASSISEIANNSGSVVDAASTAGSSAMEGVSTAADSASTAASGASDMGGLVTHSGLEATSPTQGGYFVGVPSEAGNGGWFDSTMNYFDRMQNGSEGSFGDALGNISKGNYAEGLGYLGNKMGGMVMKGGGAPSASPVTINAQQPNPDNSYLQRLRRLSRGY